MLMERISKTAVVAALAFLFSLVAFGNITDYGANLPFVQHVLTMDTIFPSATIRYRAIEAPALQQVAYLLIIAVEVVSAGLCWFGFMRLLRHLRAPSAAFNRAKSTPSPGLRSATCSGRSDSSPLVASGSGCGCHMSGTALRARSAFW